MVKKIAAQGLLPFIQEGATRISDSLTVTNENGQWTYFNGLSPVCTHSGDDIMMFRMMTSSFIASGNCKNCEIIEAFGVSKPSVIRYLKKYRERGSEGFYPRTPPRRRGAPVLTPEAVAEAEELLESGLSRSETARDLNITLDTLSKGIQQGRVKLPEVGKKK